MESLVKSFGIAMLLATATHLIYSHGSNVTWILLSLCPVLAQALRNPAAFPGTFSLGSSMPIPRMVAKGLCASLSASRRSSSFGFEVSAFNSYLILLLSFLILPFLVFILIFLLHQD